MSEWEIMSFVDSPIEIVDGDRGANYPKLDDFSTHGDCLFLNAGNVTTAGFNFSDCAFVSQEKDAALRKGKLKRHDVVLTTRGTVGNVGYFDESIPYENIRINSGMVILRSDPAVLLPRFMYLFVRSPVFRDQVSSLRSGTAQPQLPIKDIKKIQITLPPIEEQRAIAHILGTLDDKIELNRRMNETLEAIARTMFKSWFVDFDPVRAKMNGEPSESICQRLGLTPNLLALFPDRLVDSELGEIPEGWGVKPLDMIADYLNGLALQKFPPESETEWLPVIKIAQLKKGESIGADRASYNLKPEYVVNDGDMLFSWSGSLAVDIWCGGRGALNQHLFKVTSANYPKWFYYQWTKHHLENFQAIAAGKAVTMGHIQRKHLTQALCAAPRKPLMDKLNAIMAPLLDKQIENRKASRTLAMVRDELLPKLLSGELRVPAAEKTVELMT